MKADARPINEAGDIVLRQGRKINGAAIQLARQTRGWSREELAAHLRVAGNTIHRWETGRGQPLRAFEPGLEAFVDETNRMLRTGRLELPEVIVDSE